MEHRRRGGRLVRVGAGALALTGVLAGCSSEEAEGGSGALDAFHEQELSWEGCADYPDTAGEAALLELAPGSECARMDVPLDYEDPEGELASVAVLRVPARGESMGSLVYNPGGPGGSGVVGAALAFAGLAESEITERFDLVGFDPRGVGATSPAVDCYTDEEADTGVVPMGSQGTTVSFTEDDTREIMERCAEGSGGVEVLEHLGTRDTARDMDVLRAVLGEEELTYFGQSYGTRLGAVYAEQFPDRVRAMVLDGAMSPLEGSFERRVNAYAGFQGAFDEMAAACAAETDCPLGTDPERATERFQEIVRPLREEPVPALGAELDFDGAVGGVISGLYSPQSWPRIIDGIAEVEEGRGDTLMQLIYDFGLRGPDGRWPNSLEANHAINCMDEERLTPEQGGELREATYAQAPFMDPGVDVTDGARDGCEAWPVEPELGFPHAEDIEGLPDTLVVSITGDPSTPHAGGIELADTLGSALLTVEGEGHGIVSLGSNECVDEAAARYLIDLEVPEKGATCTL
ncbi:alpha/beta hydrolase [Nocardiopsis sp. B62]|uniref:alpha/beta hydrolase n=1 Tax=Nocardiopsis sp. B62 TaxID=2824874 RepID=UPI001B389663|nr:alpha/beta hydrolase [Nocardiopsis sp. B62]MBQ1082269.1 alpha/beta fold hydrolase [Nocardiopsis sp. B62]